jgi:hypothetical protein
MKRKLFSYSVFCLSLVGALGSVARGAAIVPVSLSNTLAAGDDQTSGNVSLGFSINLAGTSYSALAVNTNGNLSLGDGGYGNGTPQNLATTSRVLIAPFWADVDTRGIGTIQYGTATIAGRQSFVATYSNVGYYMANTAKTNSFQVILFNRSDLGAGAFDVEFNFDRIQWESGDNSGGVNGLGGTSAVVGVGATQLMGSLVPGSFVDGSANSLVANSLNARDNVVGRYDFSVRNGAVVNPIPEPATVTLLGVAVALAGLGVARKSFKNTN